MIQVDIPIICVLSGAAAGFAAGVDGAGPEPTLVKIEAPKN